MADTKVKSNPTVLSFQPFPILAHGGGARILRRLVEENVRDVQFLSFVGRGGSSYPFSEMQYIVFPNQKNWMRWYLKDVSHFIRNKLLYRFHARKIQSMVATLDFDVLHVVDHGNYADILTQWASDKNIPIWVSFHDHFKTTNSFKSATKSLWNNASKRMVISEEMGVHYSELFGNKDYLVVTDGLKDEDISAAKSHTDLKQLKVYFAGLLHVEYYELFQSFCEALNILSKEKGVDISLVLRGTQKLDFLDSSSINIDYRGFTLDQKLLKQELNECDILYLPIKYGNPDFYKYSFSTKMVGYLGAPGNIFYHGPHEAAAARFLERHNCGIICDSLEPKQILEKLAESIGTYTYSVEAKKVAFEYFQLKTMQQLFWSGL